MAGLAGLSVALASAEAADALLPDCASVRFPAPWHWHAASLGQAQPRPATEADGLRPLIEQVRAGKVVARYTSLGSSGRRSAEYVPDSVDASGGAFSRAPFMNYQDGDLFLVYPAVYSGPDQQPWIGPKAPDREGEQSGFRPVPSGITVRGVTLDGVRPVIRMAGQRAGENTLGQSAIYVAETQGVTIENIDVDGRGAIAVGKAGIYVNGAQDLTLRNMRITGFTGVNANGVFATPQTGGTLTLENLILSGNGGDHGPEHNVYVNESEADPGFTVRMSGSWSSDVYYGHLFKSRAQRNLLVGNFFMGGNQRPGGEQREAYLVDIPDGGILEMRNNILVKGRSGADSNGAFVTFGVESLGARPHALSFEHNTLVALSATFDGRHPLRPLFAPGLGRPRIAARVESNALVGACRQGARWPAALSAGNESIGFDAIRTDYTLVGAGRRPDQGIVGTPAYRHPAAGTVPRNRSTVGALD